MRVFIGIDLDDDVRADLASLCEAIRTGVPAWHPEKWVPAENLHLTLKFLGKVDPASVDDISSALREGLAAQDPFELRVAEPVEAVPVPGRARMLWTRCDDTDGRCAVLARRIDDTLVRFGIEPESRPFVPHITLVRTRRPKAFPGHGAFTTGRISSLSVREVTLYSSVLARSGPIYERIAHITLADR
ncbi:MAG: RNA 2',3'-cyclic phosphodiesterase [Anaerosomatales bacterium]|nr:RNA 2',3'-cyclic phosphodiesterase [Anaerosomatales bacterium]